MKNLKKVFIIIFLFLILINLLCFKSDFYSFNSPDENSLFNFAVNTTKLGKIIFEENLDNENPYKIASRGSVILKNGEIAPNKFFGFSFVLKTFEFIGKYNLHYVLYLFYFLLFLIIYLINNKIFENKLKVFLVTILIILLPTINYWFAKGFMEDLPSIFFLLCALNILLTQQKSFLFFYLFIGIAIFIKPLYLLYVIPFIVFFDKNNIIKNLKYGFFLVLYISVLLIINYLIYSSPFKSGPAVMYSSNFIPITKLSLKERIFSFVIELKDMFYTFPIMLISFFISIIYLIKYKKNKIFLYYFFTFIIFNLYLFGFSGGADSYEITSSIYRYLLFLQIISIIILFLFLLNLIENKVIFYNIIIILSILLLFSYFYNNYIIKLKNSHLESIKYKEIFYNYIQNKKINRNKLILITNGYDKFLFPEIKTVIIGDIFPYYIYKKEKFSICEIIKYYKNKKYDILISGYNINLDNEKLCFKDNNINIKEENINNYKIFEVIK